MKRKNKFSEPDLLGTESIGIPPDFLSLLRNPLATGKLPQDFKEQEEAVHLADLWKSIPKMRGYRYLRFIFAGGSGLVFQVEDIESSAVWAMKVGRHKLFVPSTASGVPPESPFSDAEISALEQISHPNIVALHDRITDSRGVIALVTTYVPEPKQLDEYLVHILAQTPVRLGVAAFSPSRLEAACAFLIERFREIASALEYMHSKGMFHCDVKPANILIGTDRKAILTDLGSCLSTKTTDTKSTGELRIHFTWTYAHPELRDLYQGDVKSISGGGLKASAKVNRISDMPKFDLFALGRTIQESLAVLALDFAELSNAAYGFRFLHIVSCLLLDGHNAPITDPVSTADGHRFVNDIAQNYPPSLFAAHKLQTASQLLDRLFRSSRDYSWNSSVPELDPWHPDAVNTGTGKAAPYTPRIAAIFNHPAVMRLKSELQLGWVKEVYPGATHTRWSHSLGVLANVIDYYNALLADPELPTARLLLSSNDIAHGLVAAILHDVGQTAFGHDLEVVDPAIFDHESLIPRLLNDTRFGSETLKQMIERIWKVNVGRILAILSPQRGSLAVGTLPVDGLACDMISGPIDADKLDYLVRDSIFCGVPYGQGIDRDRFLKSLTVEARASDPTKPALHLAYRAKGAAAVESLLLSRYQLYGAIYWQHTFRCIQAMFVHAAADVFEKNRNSSANQKTRLKTEFYDLVVCRGRFNVPITPSGKGVPVVPTEVREEPALHFVWSHATEHGKMLIERLAARKLYKRVYELRFGEMQNDVEYAYLQQQFAPDKRLSLSELLQKHFMDAVNREIAKRGAVESRAENVARRVAQELAGIKSTLIVVDFPIRGIPDEMNNPPEIGDTARKYISGRSSEPARGRNVFRNIRKLQIEIATLRVFADARFHELIIRYLRPAMVEECVFAAIPKLTRPS